MKRTNLAIGVLLVALGVSGQAAAVLRARADFQAAVNNCQGALPSFEGALRKRPLGIANEGSTTAFISCAISVETADSTGINFLSISFTNRGVGDANVACTLVDGVSAPSGTPRFLTKSFFGRAGRAIGGFWSKTDNGGNDFVSPSISCALPPQVEINTTQSSYATDVGP